MSIVRPPHAQVKRRARCLQIVYTRGACVGKARRWRSFPTGLRRPPTTPAALPPASPGGGRRKVALLAQGCRIRRACRRIRNTARRAREPSEPPDGWCGERGPAVCAAACDEPRFLCPLDTRNACAQRNRGRPAPMARAVGAATRLPRRLSDHRECELSKPLTGGVGGRLRDGERGGAARRVSRARRALETLARGGPGQTRTHAASGGRGDAPTAAGAATRLTRRANATRPLLCAAGAWPGGMRRHLQLAAFLAPEGH